MVLRHLVKSDCGKIYTTKNSVTTKKINSKKKYTSKVEVID